jgi:hypothetical protein
MLQVTRQSGGDLAAVIRSKPLILGGSSGPFWVSKAVIRGATRAAALVIVRRLLRMGLDFGAAIVPSEWGRQ